MSLFSDNKFDNKLIWLFFSLLLFSFFLANSYNYLDPDLGWHLKIGQEIVTERSVPHLENKLWPIYGAQWVDHEWLMNFLTYGLYSHAGYVAVSVFFALLAVFTVFLTVRHARQDRWHTESGLVPAMILIVLGVMGMSSHLGVRMQEITLVFFALQLIILERFRREKHAIIFFWLIPLYIIWASAHAGFLIGLVVLAGFTLSLLLERTLAQISWFRLDTDVLAWRSIAWSAAAVILAVAGTLCTPYGFRLYDFLAGYTNTAYMRLIQEWLPVYALPLNPFQVIYLAVAAAALTANLWLAWHNSREDHDGESVPYRFRLWDLGLILLFYTLAIKSKRHFPLFFVASFPVLASFAATFLYVPRSLRNGIAWRRYARPFFGLITVLVIALLLAKTAFTDDPFSGKRYCDSFPCNTLAFLRTRPDLLDKPLLNEYAWGGYLDWVWPELPLFIDGRLPQYPVNGHTFLEEYLAFGDASSTPELMDRYGIGLVWIRAPKQRTVKWYEQYLFGADPDPTPRPNALRQYLIDTPGWEAAYTDEVSEIYGKIQ